MLNEHIKNQQAIQKHYQQIENRLNSLSLFDYELKILMMIF